MIDISPSLIKELRSKTGIGVAKCKEALEESKGNIELAVENLRKAGMASAVKKEGRATKEGCIATVTVNNKVAIVEINAETDFVVNNAGFQAFIHNVAEEVVKTAPASLESFLKQTYSKDPTLTIDQYRATIVQSLGENIQIKRIETIIRDKDASIGIYTHNGGKIVAVVLIEGSNSQEALAKDIAMHVTAENPEFLDADQVPEQLRTREREIAQEQVKGKPENIIGKIVDGKLNAFYDQVCLIRQKFVKSPDISITQLLEKKSKEIGAPLRIKKFYRWSVGG